MAYYMNDDGVVVPTGPRDVSADRVDIDALLKISHDNAISTSNLILQTSENTRQIAVLNQGFADLSSRMDLREQNEMISPAQKKVLKNCVGKRVYALLGIRKSNGKVSDDSKRTRSVYGNLFFARLYSDLNNAFGVSEFSEIRAIDFNDAKNMISTWTPSDGIESLKDEAEKNWSINHPEIDLNTFFGRLL